MSKVTSKKGEKLEAPPPTREEADSEPTAPTALMNSAVWEAIARYLPSEDLLSTRQVCKEWKEAMTPEFRRRHPALAVNRPTNLNGIEQFVEDLEGCNPIPYGRFEFPASWFRQDAAHPGQIAWLVELCGQQMTSIKMSYGHPTKTDVVKLFDLVFSKLPKLVELEVNSGIHIWGDNSWDFIQASTKRSSALKRLIFGLKLVCPHQNQVQLLRGAASLEYLKVPDNRQKQNLVSLHVIQDMNGPLRTLNTLKMYCLNLEELNILVQLSQPGRIPTSLKLREFSTSFSAETAHQDLWLTFFSLQSTSLERLSIGIESESALIAKAEIVIPELPHSGKLKLRIGGRRPKVYIGFFGPFGLRNLMGECLPALKTFKYYQKRQFGDYKPCKPLNADLDPIAVKYTHTTLRQLILDGTRRQSPIKLLKMVKVYPNISVLKIELKTARMMKSIWRHFNKLEELDVAIAEEPSRYPPDTIDACIIGQCPPERFKGRLLEILQEDVKEYFNIESKLKNKPGISNMTMLRNLTLTLNPDCHKITDASVYLGFALVPTLVSMRVLPHGKHGISAECQEKLKQHFGLAFMAQF